jgi:membrane protein implicated in regulation of membrane protease activity
VKRLRWDIPTAGKRPIPKHPYRDTLIVYVALGGVVIGLTALTHGNIRKAVILSIIVVILATTYSWWRWYQRLKEQQREGKGQ